MISIGSNSSEEGIGPGPAAGIGIGPPWEFFLEEGDEKSNKSKNNIYTPLVLVCDGDWIEWTIERFYTPTIVL